MRYIKKAPCSAENNSEAARTIAIAAMQDIALRGESAVREMAKKLDAWEGDILVSPSKQAEIVATVPDSIKADIAFAHEQIVGFAKAQRASIQDFAIVSPAGVRLGQRVAPMAVAGCYVPGGRYAHVCSALMSIATAKAAGVPFVVAATPPRKTAGGTGIDPATCYAMQLAGADMILALGGVQAIGAMAYGLFTGKPANIIVGPGNAYVAEAKAYLAGTGQCTIDVFAGPTESAIIAQAGADPMTIAIDLASQAEHGVNSPVWLFTDNLDIAHAVEKILPQIIQALPDPDVAATAWRDYGEIIFCDSREEMRDISDAYAPEHLQVFADNFDWWLNNLSSYGSLFLGESSTVPHGDKCSGTNHILPTKKAATYSGGLNVHKFLKIYTWQEVTLEANLLVGAAASRLSRVEGMEGHARACDWRLTRYYPEKTWDFPVYKQPNINKA